MQSEFEKKIQQQMEEFALTPGNAVWQNVAARIQEKRRRRLIFAWWMTGLILLAGGAGFWYATTATLQTANKGKELPVKTRSTVPPTTHQQDKSNGDVQQNSKQPQQQDDRGKINFGNDLPEAEIPQITKKRTPVITHVVEEKRDAGRKVELRRTAKEPAKMRPVLVATKTIQLQALRPKVQAANRLIAENTSPQQDNTPIIAGKNSAGKQERTDQHTDVAPPQELPFAVTTIDTAMLTSAPLGNTAKAETPARQDSNLAVVSTSTSKQNKPLAAHNKIRFGITIYTGVSDNKTGFPFLSGTKSAEANFSSPNSPTSGTGAVTPDFTTQLNYTMSFSYGIGFFARQPLGNKFSLTAGLNYHYFSARTQTGMKLSTARTLYDSVINTQRYVNEYFSQSISNNTTSRYSTFTNKYHLLQLPVNLEWRITADRHRPITLTAGLTPGLLLKTQALYYNRYARITYIEKEQFRSFQLAAQGGVMFTLKTPNKYAIEVGPHLILGLTNMSKAITQSNQHLFFFGVKSNVTLHK